MWILAKLETELLRTARENISDFLTTNSHTVAGNVLN